MSDQTSPNHHEIIHHNKGSLWSNAKILAAHLGSLPAVGTTLSEMALMFEQKFAELL